MGINIILGVIGKDMNKNIDRALEHYSRVTFQKDLKHLEKDVYRRIGQKPSGLNEWKNILENWFGLPAPLGASIMASTLILGMVLGMQIQTGHSLREHDVLGFDVFRADNTKLPSSLLTPKSLTPKLLAPKLLAPKL